jgi:diaminohydroxyphosphoribosylaminopyrimidine deaminase/5-amino-6-(5-phosphoribosylamino)uracil reductase
MIAKWAMTVDGKIASRTGDSRWISGEASREIVHRLRGRVDAILIGRQTANRDDPLLTARPPGPRVATRVVVDSRASLASESQLVRTAREIPVLVAVAGQSDPVQRARLSSAGCEVLVCDGGTPAARLDQLLAELARRRMTNVLVEGGGLLLGSLLDLGQIDEVHVFIAPKLLGGAEATGPIGGSGMASIAEALRLQRPEWRQVGEDLYLTARLVASASRSGTGVLPVKHRRDAGATGDLGGRGQPTGVDPAGAGP